MPVSTESKCELSDRERVSEREESVRPLGIREGEGWSGAADVGRVQKLGPPRGVASASLMASEGEEGKEGRESLNRRWGLDEKM